MFTLDSEGKRQYTLKKIVEGEVTKSAHPARFSPDDKYSRYDLTRRPAVEIWERAWKADRLCADTELR